MPVVSSAVCILQGARRVSTAYQIAIGPPGLASYIAFETRFGAGRHKGRAMLTGSQGRVGAQRMRRGMGRKVDPMEEGVGTVGGINLI